MRRLLIPSFFPLSFHIEDEKLKEKQQQKSSSISMRSACVFLPFTEYNQKVDARLCAVAMSEQFFMIIYFVFIGRHCVKPK